MKTNEKFLSFYYRNTKEVPDIHLDLKKTALLIVDMQKHFIAKDGYDALQCKEAGEWDEWEWFYDHVEKVVIPNNKRLLDCCLEKRSNLGILIAAAAALTGMGRVSGSRTGWLHNLRSVIMG